MRSTARDLAVVATIALTAYCGPPADPTLAMLAALEEAAEDRDADAFGERLSADFGAQGGMDRTAVVSQLRRYFAAYENVAIEVYDVAVADDAPEVSFVAEFSGRPRQIGGLSGFLPPGAVYRFQLDLIESDPGHLLVLKATWEALPLPGEAR